MDEIGVGDGLMAQSFATNSGRKVDNDACVALPITRSATFLRLSSVAVEVGAFYGETTFGSLQRSWGPDAVQPHMPGFCGTSQVSISTSAHGRQRE